MEPGDSLRQKGYCWSRRALAPEAIETLSRALDRDLEGSLEHAPAGVRNLLAQSPTVHELATTGSLAAIARQHLNSAAFPVRGILFDKSPGANWVVPFHQDVTIPVRRRLDAPGYGPWSVKQGVPDVQPPRDVLENMVTLRLHLDDVDESNGPLLVFPGSDAGGILDAAQLASLRRSCSPLPCLARSGDLLLMRPLLVHGSHRAVNPSRRRILHIEYAASALPGGLEWAPS